MSDPKRWCEPDGGASADVRALLQEGMNSAPTSDEKQAVWTGLAAHLDLVPAPPAHGPDAVQAGQAAAAAGSGALITKIGLAVVLVASGTTIAVHGVSSRRAQKPKVAIASVAPARPTEPSRPLPPAEMPRNIVGEEGPEAVAVGPTPSPVATPMAPRKAPASLVASGRARSESTKRGTWAIAASPTVQDPLPTVQDPLRMVLDPRPTVQESPPALTLVPKEERAAEGASASLSEPVSVSHSAIPEVPLRTDARSDGPSPTMPSARLAIGTTPTSVNQLLEESRCLDRARTALRAGAVDRALRELDDCSRQIRVLTQEREALTIEAEAAKPERRSRAVERARAFLLAYPDSPYRARIKALVFESP